MLNVDVKCRRMSKTAANRPLAEWLWANASARSDHWKSFPSAERAEEYLCKGIKGKCGMDTLQTDASSTYNRWHYKIIRIMNKGM